MPAAAPRRALGVSSISAVSRRVSIDERADFGRIDEKAEVLVLVMIVLAEVAHLRHLQLICDPRSEI